MSEKCTTRLAIASGLLLIISSIASAIWQPPTGQTKTINFIAHYLYLHWIPHVIYIITSLMSAVLIIPVIIQFSIILYKKRPNGAIIAGAFFCTGIILHLSAILGSISRWIHAIPLTIAKNKTGIILLETLNTNYGAFFFTALFLIYSAAIIWAISLWNLYRMASAWLYISIILIISGIPAIILAPGAFQIFSSGSVISYAMAYFYLGTIQSNLSKSGD